MNGEDPPDTLFSLDPHTHARNSDPPTSHLAAGQLRKVAMMRRLLRAYAENPEGLTAEEASRLAGYDPAAGAWKRCSDLLERGWIVDTGHTRRADTGRAQAVRRISLLGVRVDMGEAT